MVGVRVAVQAPLGRFRVIIKEALHTGSIVWLGREEPVSIGMREFFEALDFH